MAVDPERLGGLAWTRRTGGALTARERRRLLGEIAKAQGEYVVGRIKLATGRVPKGAGDEVDLTPPDSALARSAEEACAEQSPVLVGHSYRTWGFGRALAAVDRVELDPERFYLASLLHDHGLDHPVANQDFTLRSAERAARCADDVPDAVLDAITVHSTAGLSVERDGALGTYLSLGAVCDLGGLRAWDLSRPTRERVDAGHPRDGLAAGIAPLIRAEARSNPKGRFALLRRCGIIPLFRVRPR